MFRSPPTANDNPKELLATETLMRANAAFMTDYVGSILIRHNCLFSHQAYGLLLDMNAGKFRKDGITPNVQHEQCHILNADVLLKLSKNKLGWDEAIYGDKDAFFAAILLHDAIEDGGITGNDLLSILKLEIEKQYVQREINHASREKFHRSAEKAVEIVRILSRNEPLENGDLPNRIQYTQRILRSPPAILIKYLDWINKVGTMPGVEAFEKDGQARLKRNLNETFEIFDNQQQAFGTRAIRRHPSIGEHVKNLDAYMGLVAYEVQGYVNRSDKEYEGNPLEEEPYNFSPFIPRFARMAKHLVGGANMVDVLHKERFVQIGQTNSVIEAYNNHVIGVPLAPLYTNQNFWHLTRIFGQNHGTGQETQSPPSWEQTKPKP